jgi:SanA protein
VHVSMQEDFLRYNFKVLKFLARVLSIIILVIVGLLVVISAPRIVTSLYTFNRIMTIEDTPAQKVAIVFGAGLWRDGSPSPVLRDRVDAAAELYFSGKAEKILMSGTTVKFYNEPKAMRNYALSLGIPNEAIVQDYAGLRTYDTCLRAREIYGVRQAILVTQSFHLPRALYLCNMLGVKSTGVSADLREYRKESKLYWNIRELPATIVALWEVHISHPMPALGVPEPIYPSEAQ